MTLLVEVNQNGRVFILALGSVALWVFLTSLRLNLRKSISEDSS